jgi:hypothetical protein
MQKTKKRFGLFGFWFLVSSFWFLVLRNLCHLWMSRAFKASNLAAVHSSTDDADYAEPETKK